MPTTRQLLTISLPPAFLKNVVAIAKAEGRTKSELVREALRRYTNDFEIRRFRQDAIKRLGSRPIPTRQEIVRIVRKVRREGHRKQKTA